MNCSRLSLPVAAILATAAPALAEIPLGPRGLSLDGSIAVRESWDSNPRQAHGDRDKAKDSFVTTLTPTLGLTWKKPAGLDTTLRLEYAPSAHFYHNLPTESHLDHAVSFSAKGRVTPQLTYETTNALRAIDGEDTSFTYHEPHGAPALGAVAMRDRRDALVFRGAYKAQYTLDNVFVRPVAYVYTHDWHIQQKPTRGYANFTNRADYNGGVDLGYRAYNAPAPKAGDAPLDLWLVAGYRYGYQYQGRVLGNPLQYSNTYHRALFGAEGRPFTWLKLAFLIGPDFRDFSEDTSPGFNEGRVRLYEEASITLIPTPDDEIGFSSKIWTFPASSGRNVYADSTYAVSWRHRIDQKLSFNVGFTAANGDWESPAIRHDWWFIPRAGVTYQFTKELAGELTYSAELGRSSDYHDRNFDRHIVSLAFKYSF